MSREDYPTAVAADKFQKVVLGLIIFLVLILPAFIYYQSHYYCVKNVCGRPLAAEVEND